jgi:transglutaminase-like putative cysteine protease
VVGVNRVLGLAALIAAAAAPGLAVSPAYAEPDLVAAVLTGWAAAGVLVTALLHRWLSAASALVMGLPVAFAGVVALVAAFPGRAEGLWPGTVDAVAHSGARILTMALPTPVAADTLALPALTVWRAGAAGALALGGGAPLTAVLGPLLALVGAAVVNGPEVRPAYVPAAVFALAAVVVLALSADQRADPGGAATVVAAGGGRRRALTRALSVGAVLALVASLTVYLGPLALYSSPFRPADLRAEVTPPEETTDGVSPLSYLAAWSAEPGERLMTVTGEEPTELRWVTLSDFDGITWQAGGRYVPVGENVPSPEFPLPARPVRAVDVEIEALPGHWLPSPGIARQVAGAHTAFDPASGGLRVATGAAEGAAYRVAGVVPQYEEETLTTAEEPDREEFAEYLELPAGAPPQIAGIAAEVGTGTPYQRANRLAAHLRSNYGFDPESPGGHGYANLAEFLVEPGEQGGGGTSEQFASAFALLARASGLPSRVVVGFGPGTAVGDGGDDRIIRSGDAVAWGEVYLEGVGWAPFDVMPGDPKENGATPESETGVGADPGEAAGGTAAEEDGLFSPSNGPIDVGDAWARVGRTVAWAVAAAVAAALLAGAARVVRRRYRLAAREPERRLHGAWWELRDGLRMAGAAPRPSDTVTDVLARSDALLPAADGRPRTWALGTALNALAFMGPASGAPRVDAGAARAAADEVRTYTAALRAELPRSRRVLWWLDPRPLLWRRR